MRIFLALFLALHLLTPIAVQAQTIIKTPLSYSLQEYGIVLATALLGGAANWYIKAKSSQTGVFSLAALVGELCVSAFAGLLAFWICEGLSVQPLYTAAVVGMAGHAGARGLNWLEKISMRNAARRLGIDEEQKDAP